MKATFYLPLADNDGRDLSNEIQEVEDQCFIAFGALTQMGLFKGLWRTETGVRKIDINAIYMVILDDNGLDELKAIRKRFKAKTTQEAVFLEVSRDVETHLI